jgi:hypothetical protein
MKEIKLSQGKVALVDDEDFELLNKLKWCYGSRGYAVKTTHYRDSTNKRHTSMLWMHRVVATTPAGMFTDHINGDKLDNRRENLRIVTQEQNAWNTKTPRHNTTGIKGIYWRANRWEAAISKDSKKVHLGRFASRYDAEKAYENAALKLRGKYVRTII